MSQFQMNFVKIIIQQRDINNEIYILDNKIKLF